MVVVASLSMSAVQKCSSKDCMFWVLPNMRHLRHAVEKRPVATIKLYPMRMTLVGARISPPASAKAMPSRSCSKRFSIGDGGVHGDIILMVLSSSSGCVMAPYVVMR